MLKWIRKQIWLYRLNKKLKEVLREMRPMWNKKGTKGFWNKETAEKWNKLEGQRQLLMYGINHLQYFDELTPHSKNIVEGRKEIKLKSSNKIKS